MRASTMKALAVAVVALAAAAYAQSGLSFTWFGPASRIITPTAPNGLNAVAFFCFDNPAPSAVAGQIFNLAGREVTTLGAPQQAPFNHVCNRSSLGYGYSSYLPWDGTNNGAVVHSGVYIYRVQSEGKSYTGTLVVVR